ncbi:MAG: WXG100 family type VII secretion target [Acidobacteriota bacterium]
MRGSIKMYPEQLERAAREFKHAKESNLARKKKLDAQFDVVRQKWEGLTPMQVLGVYDEWTLEMKMFFYLIDEIAADLTHAAQEMRAADQRHR